RLAVFPGPARGGHVLGGERRHLGRGRRRRDFGANRQQDHHLAAGGGRQLLGERGRRIQLLGRGGEPPAGGQQGGDGRGPARGRLLLVAHPAGEKAGYQRHGQEDEQRQDV